MQTNTKRVWVKRSYIHRKMKGYDKPRNKFRLANYKGEDLAIIRLLAYILN